MVDLIKKEQSSDYIYITEDRGIKKKILKEGKDEYVIDGSQVYINYIGKIKQRNKKSKNIHLQ